jgi:hypothetical protein
MTFARWLFAIAGIYGFLLITPIYFAEAQIGHNDPPAITHPEYFYGFIGITLAWQLAFLLIATEPMRYRPIILAAVLEKASYGIAAIALFLQERVSPMIGVFGLVDLALGTLFLVSFYLTRLQRHRFQSANTGE